MSLLIARRGVIAARAATGGGGVGSPADVSGLLLWYDANEITGLSDGDRVTSWADQSGNGNDAATNPGTQYHPLYRASGIGGMPAVEFDGVNDHFELSLSEASGPWTWFFVIDGTPNSGGYLYDADTGRFILAYEAENAGSDETSVYDGVWRNGSLAVTGVQVLEFNLESGAALIYKDKTTTVLSSGHTERALGGQQRIGTSITSVGTGTFDGLISEVIAYSGAKGTADRDVVYGYLADKYGFTF